jgi:hypothetical protein
MVTPSYNLITDGLTLTTAAVPTTAAVVFASVPSAAMGLSACRRFSASPSGFYSYAAASILGLSKGTEQPEEGQQDSDNVWPVSFERALLT